MRMRCARPCSTQVSVSHFSILTHSFSLIHSRIRSILDVVALVTGLFTGTAAHKVDQHLLASGRSTSIVVPLLGMNLSLVLL